MKKAYLLDFSIERDTDRLVAVQKILDGLDKDPTPTELEQMANYILYGKDENGHNAIMRHESKAPTTRYSSYKTADDKVLSLDEMMENPMFNEEQIRSARQRNPYKKPDNTIKRPRYDKQTGELIDPGDSDIPGMVDLWDTIDRWQHTIDVLQGKVAPNENDTNLNDNSYRVYRLKHNLIDIRRHQYYLKDAYKPTLHFQNLDHPKTQFYDWTGDSFYWISREEWQQRVSSSYSPLVSRNIEDYEVDGDKVKWVVCKHTFDWENPKHVRALMSYWDLIYGALYEKLDTYGRTLIWDFEHYVEQAQFSPLRLLLIDLKLKKVMYQDIIDEVEKQFGIEYNLNHLSTIINNEIPNKIALVAKRERLLIDTPPDKWQVCSVCGKNLPLDPVFFNKNASRKSGFFTYCKECAKQMRIDRGQTTYDRRLKDSPVS